MQAERPPSGAHGYWELYLLDAEACHGLRSPARGVDASEDGALGRASVVALAAAFQRYVVELFVVSLEAVQLAGLEERERESRYARQIFSNPSPAEIDRLFQRVFDQERICDALDHEERDVLLDHLGDRHEIAHGRDTQDGRERRRFGRADMGQRMVVLGRIVRKLDRRANTLVQAYGGAPW